MKEYFAEIGRRGGIRSRRVLNPETARRMVRIREARRLARRSQQAEHFPGRQADTSVAAQAVQDSLLRRSSPAEKLAHVARLARMVDELSLTGIRMRNPGADEQGIRFLRAELRLGRELAVRVYGEPSGA